jgi:hypothetical protein
MKNHIAFLQGSDTHVPAKSSSNHNPLWVPTPKSFHPLRLPQLKGRYMRGGCVVSGVRGGETGYSSTLRGLLWTHLRRQLAL